MLTLCCAVLCCAPAQEYADQERLKGLVSRYSEFIDFPIYLQVGTTLKPRTLWFAWRLVCGF
jgi:hypothetical protein